MIFRKLQPFVIASLLTASAAWAKDLERKEKVARAACLSGDYARGVAILSELFVETEDAVFIFNQGRCFEQNRRYEDAIARFQEYLRAGRRLSKEDKVEAQKHIADCQGLLAQQTSTAAPTGAPAVDQANKEARERAAKKACLTGEPVAGVGILTDLYLDTSDPTFLFNQGRCFEQNRRYEDAIGRFREYLVKAKGLSTDAKADAERHIATCESYLREKPVAGPKPEAAKGATEQVPIADGKPAEVVAGSAKPIADRPGKGLRIAGGIVAGLGVAGLAAGLVLNLKVNSMTSDLGADWNPATDSTRKGYKTAGQIAYGTGAVCLLGGVILYYLGWRERTTSIAVVPTVGPGMAGTFVTGAF